MSVADATREADQAPLRLGLAGEVRLIRGHSGGRGPVERAGVVAVLDQAVFDDAPDSPIDGRQHVEQPTDGGTAFVGSAVNRRPKLTGYWSAPLRVDTLSD